MLIQGRVKGMRDMGPGWSRVDVEVGRNGISRVPDGHEITGLVPVAVPDGLTFDMQSFGLDCEFIGVDEVRPGKNGQGPMRFRRALLVAVGVAGKK
jgi:hypothetical protein